RARSTPRCTAWRRRAGWSPRGALGEQPRGRDLPPHPGGARAASAFLQADWRSVTPGYFQALGIRLKRGRLVAETDVRAARPVVVGSERMAAKVWPGEDPIGKRVRVDGADQALWTVVGVVGDVRDGALEADPREVMYLSYREVPWTSMWFVVR